MTMARWHQPMVIAIAEELVMLQVTPSLFISHNLLHERNYVEVGRREGTRLMASR
jgi:hypothetical protein